MSEFDRRQLPNQNNRLVSPTRYDRAMLWPAHSENPLPTRQQAVGNQAAERFAQSCPVRLHTPGACPFGGVCYTCPARVQARLTIDNPGDKYEQEADRVADMVMRMPQPYTRGEAAVSEQSRGIHIQQACTECAEELRRHPLDEEEEEKELLQAKEVPGHTPPVTPTLEGHIHQLQGRGQAFPVSTRAFFETRFGRNFGQVRIHTDHRAGELTRGPKGVGPCQVFD